MDTAFQAAIYQALAGGADVVWGDTGLYALTGNNTLAATRNSRSTPLPLDCTFLGSGAQYGLNFRQTTTPSVNLPANTRAGILVTHSLYTVFDLTGCNHFTFYDLSLVTNNGGSFPMTCFLTARNSTRESNLPRFFNTIVAGFFSAAILYNYASENGVYIGNYWANYASNSGACVVAITSNNYFNGTSALMSSVYVPIASGAQSCIDHEFIGGQYTMTGNASSTSDVFYLDAVESFRLLSAWVNNSGVSTGGRSIVHADTTNGAGGRIHLYSIRNENATFPAYGVYISGTNIIADISIQNCYLPHRTAYLGAVAGETVENVVIINPSWGATNGGVQIPYVLVASQLFTTSMTVNVGFSENNLFVGSKSGWTITTSLGGDIKLDTSTGGLGLFGNMPAAQLTGWGAPTNGAVVNNFPGSSATLADCGRAITEIIATLKAVGLFGA